jgi:hypothetical protein
MDTIKQKMWELLLQIQGLFTTQNTMWLLTSPNTCIRNLKIKQILKGSDDGCITLRIAVLMGSVHHPVF